MNIFIKILKTTAVFILIFLFFFYLINYKTINLQIKYYFNSLYYEEETTIDAYLPAVESRKSQKPIWPENHIVIPKVKINVPIVWNVPINESLNYLDKGVVHTKGSAMPGQPGNVFISGHSSYFWSGPYSSIFAMIHELKKNDEIAIVWNNYTYKYRVYNSVVISPNQVEYLNQDRSKRILSLMTCTPIGTDWKRLIVQAELIN
jgi:sortase A